MDKVEAETSTVTVTNLNQKARNAPGTITFDRRGDQTLPPPRVACFRLNVPQPLAPRRNGRGNHHHLVRSCTDTMPAFDIYSETHAGWLLAATTATVTVAIIIGSESESAESATLSGTRWRPGRSSR